MVAMNFPFQGTDGLVILHYLNGGYCFRRHILGGLIILVSHKIQSLNVQFVDATALVQNLSGRHHLDTRHTFEHILNAVVLFWRNDST